MEGEDLMLVIGTNCLTAAAFLIGAREMVKKNDAEL